MSSSTYFVANMATHPQQAPFRNDKVTYGREDGRATRKQRWGRAGVFGLAILTCIMAVVCNSLAITVGHLFLRHIPDFLLPRSVFVDANLETTFSIATLGSALTAVPLLIDAIIFWHQAADEELYPNIPVLMPLRQLTPRFLSSRVQIILWECWLVLAGPIGLFVYSAFDDESSSSLGATGLVLAAAVGRLCVVVVTWAYGRWRSSRATVQVDAAGVDAELTHMHAESWAGDTMQRVVAAAAEEEISRK